jgi:flagellar basal-body rod protein FlgB
MTVNQLNGITRHLKALSQKQAIIASNISNINTPMYKTKDATIIKSQEFNINMQVTNKMHIKGRASSGLLKEFLSSEDLDLKPNGNNVSLNAQMLKLGMNKTEYNLASELYKAAYFMLNSASDKPN